ncbi:magnesium transporter NIPA-domain-containing protein [Dissophora ornata]|nr:hypothetical protein BGZ58_007641 [Dissophora ornata]KAI8606232.1 magnesium transporter NIPA-domain-containing protein [Dissophora ornata]
MADSPSPNGGSVNPPPAYFKFIGMALAVSSGIFIGSSFVLKKKGLLRSNAVAGEGHAYLKSALWWTGMSMMIIGETCNFVAYSFAPALVVTPLGALSVVVCAVLSSLILKEKLNLHGKIGCMLCIVGAVIIVLHAPAQVAVTEIDEFRHFVMQPGFLVYMCLVIVTSLVIVWKIAPKYGKKHLLVYITICSLIGSLSVVATQGLGAAIVLNITTGTPQFNHWFIYVTLVFVICTLITEINYLNKALNLFNTAMVTPVYYVFFTSASLAASVILYQGFSASPASIMTVVMGFFVICAGVVLLQTSKSATLPDVLKNSNSTLELHTDDDRVSLIEEDKDDLDPGPMGLRAVPFDAIRQIVRARTASSSHLTTPTTPVAVFDQESGNSTSDSNSRGSPFTNSIFGRLGGRRPERSTTNINQTPRSPLQEVLIVPQDGGSDQLATSSSGNGQRAVMATPMGDKTEYSEKDGQVPIAAIRPTISAQGTPKDGSLDRSATAP